MQLAKMDKSNWAETLAQVTEIAAATLNVSRASIWLFSEDGAEAVCQDVFHAATGTHDRGEVIHTASFPRYVHALREKRTIPAGDALNHPDTHEFVDSYLRPAGVQSLLDVPIWYRGEVAGILCHEDVRGPREWSGEDQAFAASAAEMLSVALAVRERRGTEEALRLSETRFRTMFEQSPYSIQILAPNGRTLLVNRAFEELFNLGIENLREYNILIDPQLVSKGVTPYLERGLRGESAVRIPAFLYDPFLRPNDPSLPQKWIQGFLYPVKNPAGETTEIIIVHQDVTARMKADEALRESEELFKSAYERSAIAMALVDLKDRYLRVNHAFSSLFGYTPEEMTELTTASVSNPEDLVRLRQNKNLTRSIVSGQNDSYQVEKRYIRKDGSLFWAVVGVSLVRDRNGEPAYFISQVQDITERKEAEEELRRTHEELERRVEQRTAELAQANAALQVEIAERQQKASELEAIFQALPDLYFRLAGDGTILEYRSGHIPHLYAPPEVFLGKQMQDVMPPDVAEKYEASVQCLKAGQAAACFEYSLPLNGQEVEFEARLVRLPVVHGDEIITIVRDITDRVAAERALQQSEQHFRTLTENSSDVVAIFDPEGILRYQSPASERVFGYQDQEMVGKWGFEYFHPDDIAHTAALLADLVHNPGTVGTSEFRLRHKEGHYIHCEAVGRTLLPDTAEAGVVMNTRDITGRKKAEEALRESEARSRAVIQNALDCVVTIDHHGRVVEFNPAAQETFGYTREEAVGADLRGLIVPPRFQEAHRQGISRFLKTGEGPVLNRRVEVPALRKDGAEITVELAATAITDLDPPLFTAYMRDVTEQKQADAALRESEERLRFALEAGGMGTFEWFIQEGRVSWSPDLEILHEMGPGGFGGRLEDVMADVHLEDRERLVASVQAAVAGGRPHDVEYRSVLPSGKQIWLGAKGRVIRDESGQPQRMVGICTDITARKEAEVAIRGAMEEAEAANRAKSEFLSRMSHELRTPMNSILGFAQILARKPLPPDQMRSVDYILKAGRHLLELINEVLDIARIEANRMQLSLEPVGVNSILSEARNLIQPLASQRQCRIEARLDTAFDWHVRADRQRLNQVLLNLLSNAVKFNRPDGAVFLTSEYSAEDGVERVWIRVRDTGPGIAAEKLDRLFIPFERLGADQSGIEGTGLGLALSKRLVEAMGGTLTVESTEGEGSTFSIGLEQVESPLERLERSGQLNGIDGAESAPAPEKKATLLYIEDNLANLSLIETILAERSEIALLSALQGRLGLDLAWEHQPDLILLDLHLPDMSGENVLRRLQAEPRTAEIPVVVISADATAGTIERLLGAGAHGYLPKPLDVDQFLNTVDEILERE